MSQMQRKQIWQTMFQINQLEGEINQILIKMLNFKIKGLSKIQNHVENAEESLMLIELRNIKKYVKTAEYKRKNNNKNRKL